MTTGTMIELLLLQIILILLNAFFAATEIAVISLNPAKLRQQAEDGNKTLKRILRLAEEPSGFLSTIQIGITLAGFLASAFAAENFSDPLVNWLVNTCHITILSPAVLDTIAIIVITIILSYFTLVFGELVPKRIAMQKPLGVAKFSSAVVSGLSVIMKPVIWLLAVSTNGVLRLFGMKTDAQEEAVTEEEIRLMVDIGHKEGNIDREEKEWIENVFEFGELTARDVMTHRGDIVSISEDDEPDEILGIIKESGLSRFPVYEAGEPDEIIGILSAREYLLNLREQNPKGLDALLRTVYFVPDSVAADTLFQDMQQQKIHIAVVVDEYGQVCGIVTMEDLLEEIVGNIYDEFDPREEPEIQKTGENTWRISGDVDIETIEEELNVQLPKDREYDTLSGLVFSQQNFIPEDGSVLEVFVDCLSIKTDPIASKRVEWATVQKIMQKQEEQKE